MPPPFDGPADAISAGAPGGLRLTPAEFALFQERIYRDVGIHLAPAKMNMVVGRLGNRVQQCGFRSFGDYFRFITSSGPDGRDEYARMLELISTNETYFFREPQHLKYLREAVLASAPRTETLRLWSAGSSSGEEAYSIAITCAEHFCGALGRFEVLGTDISQRVLQRANVATYGPRSVEKVPPELLSRYFLRGVGTSAGQVRVRPELRQRVHFELGNLNVDSPKRPRFDVIFCRNVMIYFDAPTKRAVATRLLAQLRPGGFLFIGHSESLQGLIDGAHQVTHGVYRTPSGARR